MSDDAAAGQGQEPTGEQQQQGQEPADGQQQSTEGTGGQEPQTPSLDGITDPVLRSYVEKQISDAAEARRGEAAYRTRAQAAEAKVTEAQRANETAEQTAQREAQEREQETARLRAENKALKVGGQWSTAANAAKALDAQALLSLIGGPDKIETDDDGKATNLDTLLKAAKKDYPWAFTRVASADAAEGGQGTGPQSGGINSLLRGGRR